MNVFIEWCIISSMIAGYFNFAFLLIIDNKLREIKSEISRLKKREMRCGIMFRIVGAVGEVRECYGCFVDECGVVQFIINDGSGHLVTTNSIKGYWTIMKKGGEG